jgi:DNA-binding Lrp family transcriptional regulator
LSTINGSQTTAYLLIEVPAKKSGDVASRLVEDLRQYVPEAHAVWGEADVIAKVSAPSPSVLADLVMEKIQRMTHVTLTSTFITIEGMHFRSKLQVNTSKSDVDAFVFISVEAAKSEGVARFLVETLPENVLEAHAVWGGADVVARVTAKDLTHLSELIMSSIQNVQHVSVTRTYLLISGLSEFSGDMKHVYESEVVG